MKTFIKVTTSLLLGSLIFSGCMGGGTIGTGVTSLGGVGPQAVELRFTVFGHVKDSSGKTVSNAKIEIVGSHGTTTTISDAKGSFRFLLSPSSGEELLVTVSVKGKTYLAATYISPAGRSEVPVLITLRPAGALTIDVIE